MNDSFPLCRAAGLRIQIGGGAGDHFKAGDVENLLASALVVYNNHILTMKDVWCDEPQRTGTRGKTTHTARLLMVQPIVRDTAESLLAAVCSVLASHHAYQVEDLVARARRLLEESK